MAEDTKTSSTGEADPIKNLKEEFSRKMGNVEKNISSLEATNKQLLAQLQALAPKQAPAKQSNLENDWFDKPEAAAEEIVKRAEARIESKWQRINEDNAKQQSTLSSLVGEFPELQNGNHELTQAAVVIYNSMSDEDKRSPAGYKAAVREAALDLGYKPMKKRSEEEQDFSLRGGNSQSSNSERKSRSGNKAIDPATIEFAKRIGVNMDDPKVKERIANKHGRKSYTRYE
mgnify:CR=1 FL=1